MCFIHVLRFPILARGNFKFLAALRISYIQQTDTLLVRHRRYRHLALWGYSGGMP
jgi:hypothetical protein